MDFECIVVGGGPAGLSAALLLGRARRNVLVLDSEAPRNHAAVKMHGVLGHDGLSPRELHDRGVEELRRYDIEVRVHEVSDARAVDGGFALDGMTAKTVILATGLLDDTLDLPGFDEIYGVCAHTCPYCDGWEHRDARIAVLAAGEDAEHTGLLLRQWSDDVLVLDPATVKGFHCDDGDLTSIEMKDGSRVERDAVFFNSGMRPRTALAKALGCDLDDDGYVIAGDDRATSVDGVFAAGNCTDPAHNVPLAIADGARAGAAVNLWLLDQASSA